MPPAPHPLPYLQGYPEALLAQVAALAEGDGLGGLLLRRYPQAHAMRDDKSLYRYAADLKARHLRHAAPVNKVVFDSKIHVMRHALGLHTASARVQGGRLSARHEIRVASMFKRVPEEFLRMIVVQSW